MLYRLLHAINRNFALTVLWLYIAAFVLAFAFMFLFPQVTLLLLFLGLGGLGVAVLAGWALRAGESVLARHALRNNVCPHCRRRNQPAPSAQPQWRCEHCAAIFLPDGMEVVAES